MLQAMLTQFFYRLEDFRLYLHFTRVLRYLTQNQPTIKTVEQQLNRQSLIELLRIYRQAGIFPRNPGGSPKPYFFDTEQRACAVAYLLQHTGEQHLAYQISAWKNTAYVEEMAFPELANWANNYGVSQDDLKLIQPSYVEPTVPGLLILLTSCANLLFVLLHGSRHIAYTLLGFMVTLALLYGSFLMD